MTTTVQKCVHCNSKTNKPKFCSSSCAAIYNNKLHPKRKPEGKCTQCGVSISATKQLCSQCKIIKRQEEIRKNQNIRILQGPNGQFERKLPFSHCSSSVVFSSTPFNKITAKSTCEELLDYLLSLIMNKPDYILPTDIKWLSAMLVHLLESNINYKSWQNHIVTNITKFPVEQISHYLREWVESFFKKDIHPLLPTFALATCQFIDRHLFGYIHVSATKAQPTWKIEPWFQLDSLPSFHNKNIYFLDDKQFKKSFTEKMGYLHASCNLPNDCYLTMPKYAGLTISKASNFDFLATRCYLSESLNDNIVCHLQNMPKIKFDIFHDFEFTGTILSIEDKKIEFPIIQAKIPIRWIIGTKSNYTDSAIFPLPSWLTN